MTLPKALSSLSLKNAYIYVGDAVRWDHCPTEVRERGRAVETIAASINSPTSFPSLVTGRFPPNHGVFSFTQQIPDSIHRLFDLNHQTRFVNSIQGDPQADDPIYSVLGVDKPADTNPLSGLSEPFALMERGPGGHAPYANFEGDAGDYFAARGTDLGRIRAEYRTSVERDAVLFRKRLEALEERGVLEDTIVIYTSDHGELLGEGGMLGHNAPMRPELVRVPTVFVTPTLGNGDTAWSNGEGVFRHVDLLPTLYELLGIEAAGMDGRSLTSGLADGPAATFMDDTSFPDRFPIFEGRLAYEGAFDADGGVVFARSSLSERLARLTGKIVGGTKKSFLRRHMKSATGSYVAGDRTYGAPGFTEAQASDSIDVARKNTVDAESVDLSDAAYNQLQELGYI